MKTSINYDRLQNFNKNITPHEDIKLWVDEFIINTGIYLKKPHFNELIKSDKGCNDFNYLIEQIKQRIISLFDKPWESLPLTEKIKDLKENFFSNNTDLTCKKNDMYLNHSLKPLYDFCEDEIFIKSKLSEIQKSSQCEQIIADMSERKVMLKPQQEILKRQIISTRIRNISCDPAILDDMFPFFNCTPSTVPPLISGTFATVSNHSHGEESAERLRTGSSYSFGELIDTGQETIIIPESSEPSSGSSNAIGLVSLPILGVCVCSFLLYKVSLMM